MRYQRIPSAVLAVILSVCIWMPLSSCGGGAAQPDQPSQERADASTDTADQAAGEAEATDQASGTAGADAVVPADGTYEIEVDTDSSMFRSEACVLAVKDGVCTAELVLPGEGFSRLYFGSAEEAQSADDADIYDYRLNDDGKYTFDIPVSALDQELPIAAFGQRRDTWYDHTITFHAPAA